MRNLLKKLEDFVIKIYFLHKLRIALIKDEGDWKKKNRPKNYRTYERVIVICFKITVNPRV